ncbi:MAG: hypothetical protein J1E16_04290 [Muribaculaceae bacterium]|nr:hypothetical protein [Muribaculaceae bacterium]
MKEKWEYKMDRYPNAEGEDDLIHWFNYLGYDGWELIRYEVRHHDGGLLDVKGIFKRKIQ